MSLNRSAKDEDILAGFASFHQAMAEGFDRMARELHSVRDDLQRQIHVRNDVDRLERRVSVLEQRAS